MTKTKKKKEFHIPPKMFKGKRGKIAEVLVHELMGWESTTKVSSEEFCKLVEKLYTL